MPEISVIHIALFMAALVAGILVGWFVRGTRSRSEKEAINAGWQEQLQAQRSEHARLLDQNKSLMEQNSQYQASNKDAKMRASELSGALQEAFQRRDELQRQIKDIRGNLEVVVSERDQLQSRAADNDAVAAAVRQRDEKIFKLSRELENWQDRLPPLIERFRQRNADAERLEKELEAAREHIAALESMVGSDETRVEPVSPDALGEDLDASNEPVAAMDDNGHAGVGHSDAAAGERETGQAAEPDADDHPGDVFIPDEDFDEPVDMDDELEDQVDTDDELEDQVHTDDELEDQYPAAAADNFSYRSERDNLKLIKGVGPAIEKTLNEMGIFRFNQIAEMSEYDIDRVAHRLKGFRSRIYREDWMGQARELQVRKAGGG